MCVAFNVCSVSTIVCVFLCAVFCLFVVLFLVIIALFVYHYHRVTPHLRL
jgi:hypothetical protein